MLRLSQQLRANAMDFKGLHSSNSFSSQSHLGALINSTGLSFLSIWLLWGWVGICPTPASVVQVMSYKYFSCHGLKIIPAFWFLNKDVLVGAVPSPSP